MKIRIIYITFVFFLITEFCFSQFIFNNLSKESDLETSLINAILKDNEGFIWIGTEKGLARFDGTDIVRFNHDPNDSTTISEDIIRSLFLDHDGNIWAGTRDKGINIINPLTLNIQHLYPSENNKPGLTSGQNNAIFQDNDNNVWISSSFLGFDIYDKEKSTFTNFKPTDQYEQLQARLVNTIVCCTADPESSEFVWMGTLQGIFRFNSFSKEWIYFPITKNKAENPELYSGREEIVRDLLFISKNELWFASWGGGICKLNTKTGAYKIYKYESLEPINGYRNNVKKLLRKSDEEFWFAAEHEALGVFNKKSGQTYFLNSFQDNTQGVNNPSDIILDEEGYMFVSSYSNGLYYSQLNAHQFNKNYLPYNLIAVTGGKENESWAGSHSNRGELIHINQESSEFQTFRYNPIDNRDDNYFTKIIYTDTLLWLVEDFNLYYFDPSLKVIKPWKNFKPLLIKPNTGHHHAIRVATSDHSGNIWMGTKFHGIFKVNPSKKSAENYFYSNPLTNSLKLDEFIFSMFTDSKNRVWYGSTQFGYFDPFTSRFVNFIYPEIFADSPVKLKKIYAITETKNNEIWLGTENAGIGIIKVENDSATFIKSYTQKNGLQSNQIKEMLTDTDNNVWVLTSEGLSRIISSSGVIENYNHQYGLQNLISMSLTNNGKLFIGAKNGYYLFSPEKIHPFKNKASLYIKSFKIFDEEVDISPIIKNIDPIKLKYDQNFFSIDFGLINFFKDGPAEFQYILEGLDEHWQQAGKRTYLSYTNLKGGKYTIRINSENAEELIIPIEIETPYWETWWFYALIIIAVISLGLMLHLYRLRQIKKQEKIKSEYSKRINQLEIKALRAQMNPHFLFNSLNSIRYYILKEDNESASDYITKFSKLLRLILNNSRQSQISLYDELHALEIYIDFEQMRFNNKFSYEIILQAGFDTHEIEIQPLTIQPFVENAIWHGLMPKKEKGHLKINVSKKEKTVEIIIEDNGIGRQKAKDIEQGALEETKSFGLKITEDRMNLMESIRGKKSDFKIVDLYDNKQAAGTKVIITFEI